MTASRIRFVDSRYTSHTFGVVRYANISRPLCSGMGRPSSLAVAIHSPMIARAFATASSYVAPSAMHPASSGTSTMKQSSSLLQKIMSSYRLSVLSPPRSSCTALLCRESAGFDSFWRSSRRAECLGFPQAHPSRRCDDFRECAHRNQGGPATRAVPRSRRWRRPFEGECVRVFSDVCPPDYSTMHLPGLATGESCDENCTRRQLISPGRPRSR